MYELPEDDAAKIDERTYMMHKTWNCPEVTRLWCEQAIVVDGSKHSCDGAFGERKGTETLPKYVPCCSALMLLSAYLAGVGHPLLLCL